ncbi:D-alanyl-D-alanine carboxypeptidase [Pacificibacter marinus]|nr:D-alanyl-D-alanine carboxypeptidase [Pacificibacter marinus]
MARDVQARVKTCARSTSIFSVMLIALILGLIPIKSVMAAEYAALVMDARNGKVLHASNADTRLHPASLTKMMTLYIAFEAIENGEISLDTMVTISRQAASEPPSRLGLKAGQKIKLRYLIRAAAVKSANDAATAIGEAIEGSEAAFARRMNRTAKALGMSRTTFKNAHGLTESGHLSTARDMTVLGRHVFYDYPDYYNLFSRKTADAGVRTVTHTNSRFLNSYKGADGIKTGYTSAAGFNLVASAQHGQERIITTVFGGRSTITRNARVTELMDLGFKRAGTNVAVHKPQRPPYMGKASTGAVMVADSGRTPNTASKIVRARITMASSPLPQMRPLRALAPEQENLLLAMSDDIFDVVAEANQADAVLAAADAATSIATDLMQDAAVTPDVVAPSGMAAYRPKARPNTLQLASIEPVSAPVTPAFVSTTPEVVTRISTSGSRHWGVNIGTYGSEYEARKVLLKTALSELENLDGALRKVTRSKGGYDANFLGLSQEVAALTCRKLEARGNTCATMGPSS